MHANDLSREFRHCMERWAIRRETREESTDLDARGMVPIELARQILDEHRIMQSGIARPPREGQYRCEYLIWGSLLSLESAEEFVERAERIRWMEGPNVIEAPVLVERYGDAVKAWLLAHIREGVLVNVPRGVLSGLAALGEREVFDALWRIRDVVSDTTPTASRVTRFCKCPSDGWTILASEKPTGGDGEPHHEITQRVWGRWVRRNPELGAQLLLEKQSAGDKRAGTILRTLLTDKNPQIRVEEMDAHVLAAVGEKGMKALKKKPRIKLTTEAILDHLDACWSGKQPTAYLSWPYFEVGVSRERDEYHGLRMIVVRGMGPPGA